MALATVATLYASLLSAYTNGVGTELSGNGYPGREAVAATFDPVTGIFACSGASWGPGTGAWTAATYIGYYDASSGGSLLFVVPISTFTGANGTTLSIPANAVTLLNPVIGGANFVDLTPDRKSVV